ncbi:hypothetical protein ML462_14615 [Gramella lutea]|uniref:Uncharacterized protein n=1 Tax=Christiangramia lutea TaxID=1607951 RepID=A0A9X1V5B3_9FLAO|nr:hypothetical protein [Christiangramia lutea]MCH4824403.1 hypothetical protein [Christiangramia lutea]
MYRKSGNRDSLYKSFFEFPLFDNSSDFSIYGTLYPSNVNLKDFLNMIYSSQERDIKFFWMTLLIIAAITTNGLDKLAVPGILRSYLLPMFAS